MDNRYGSAVSKDGTLASNEKAFCVVCLLALR